MSEGSGSDESGKKVLMSLEDWMGEFSKNLTSEVLKALDSHKQSIGRSRYKQLSGQFLASYVGSMVYRTLVEMPEEGGVYSKEALYQHATKNFADIKVQIQEAISAGFEAAMTSYAKRPVEYYCQIKPVPQAVNQKPC